MNKPSEHHALPDGSGGPGKILRQARMDLGLSPEDVALQLHLAARQIVALENDDYKNLPQATYVRGYVRNYALLLGLSPEPLLAAYAAMQAHMSPTPASVAATKTPPRTDEQIRYALYGLGGVLVILVVLWWLGSYSAPAPQRVPPPESAPMATLGQSPDVAPEPTSPTTESQPQPSPEKPSDKPIAAPRPAPAITVPPASLMPAPAPAVRNEARARLILRTEQDSWADIRDARDTRLLYETVAAGRVVTLEGVPPFSVFLGNVDGVKIEFNGKSYDPSRHKRGLVARFTLGDAPVAP